MIYLILSILSTVLVICTFKILEKRSIGSFNAIIINYLICLIIAAVSSGVNTNHIAEGSATWLPWALVTGFCFIGGFNLMAITVRKTGITAASVASKNSLALSVPISLWLYGESFHWLKVSGLILAIPAIYLTVKKKEESSLRPALYIYPLAVFLISAF